MHNVTVTSSPLSLPTPPAVTVWFTRTSPALPDSSPRAHPPSQQHYMILRRPAMKNLSQVYAFAAYLGQVLGKGDKYSLFVAGDSPTDICAGHTMRHVPGHNPEFVTSVGNSLTKTSVL